VNHCFENNKPVETPEGKRNRQIREAESNQFNLIMITFDDVRKLIAKDETRTLELKKTTGELYKGMETACAFLNSDAVMGFCLKHLNLAGRMDSKYRKDTLTVPYEAIKEATINMLCHRSWNAENTTPSLAIYDDRIVFQNPGAFPLGMTWLDFVNDQIGSLPANPTIANVFYRRGTMEAFIDWWCKNIRTPSGEDFTSNHNKIHNPSNIVTPQEKVFDFCKSPKSVVEIANMLGVNDRRWVRKKYVAPFIGTKLLCLTFGLTRHRE
jgi:hypothetical protein BACCOPRO_03817